MTDDKELFELKAPSRDKYEFRYLTYGEKMNIAENKAKGLKVKSNARKFRKKGDEDAEVEIDLTFILAVKREAVWKTIVKAPWLKEGQKVTKEMVDDNVKGIDTDAINDFVEALNYPQKETVEKSNGQ